MIPFPAEEVEGGKLFEFAKAMGLRAISTESPELIDRMEKLVKEYDIMIAFHDHPERIQCPVSAQTPMRGSRSLIRERT